jgi:hypothetical protein
MPDVDVLLSRIARAKGAAGSVSIGYEVGSWVIFLQSIPRHDYFHRCTGRDFGDLIVF